MHYAAQPWKMVCELHQVMGSEDLGAWGDLSLYHSSACDLSQVPPSSCLTGNLHPDFLQRMHAHIDCSSPGIGVGVD